MIIDIIEEPWPSQALAHMHAKGQGGVACNISQALLLGRAAHCTQDNVMADTRARAYTMTTS